MWQPIETAPKDGTSILVWSAGMEEVYKAEWVSWSELPHWQPQYAEVTMLDGDETWPTHWMPLPEPPTD